MRRIAVINQKGGVGKTTTCANLGAALARLGRRVVVVDLDPQANLSLHLGQELFSEEPSSYSVLTARAPFASAVRPTSTPGLSVVPAHIDLSGAELELASTIGRETILRDALEDWERESVEATGEPPADYLILDCPPSLGLLSVNALAASREVLIAVQTEFFALQGMSKLVEIVQLLKRRLNPELHIRGILPCLYDSRLRLAREVLAEVRHYFPGQVFRTSIRSNVKLAEAPSHGITIFEYDPQCTGAVDHLALAKELVAQEEGGGEPIHETEASEVVEMEQRLVQMARGKPLDPPPAAEPSPGPTQVDPPVEESPASGAMENLDSPEPEEPEAAAPEAADPEVRAVEFRAVEPEEDLRPSDAIALEAIVHQPAEDNRPTWPNQGEDGVPFGTILDDVVSRMGSTSHQVDGGGHQHLGGDKGVTLIPFSAPDVAQEDLPDPSGIPSPAEGDSGAGPEGASEDLDGQKKAPKDVDEVHSGVPDAGVNVAEDADHPHTAADERNFGSTHGEERPLMPTRKGPRAS